MKRIFLIVLDSCGAGAMPDSEKFGDVGVNTLRSCASSEKLSIPNLRKLGIGNIEGLDFLGKTDAPAGAVCRLAERSMGRIPPSAIGRSPVWCPRSRCPPIRRASLWRC